MDAKQPYTIHTQACDEAFAKAHDLRKEFEEKHPNFCRICGGQGVFYESYDPSPAGVSLGSGSMTDVYLCEECVEQNKCPLCGQETLNEDGTKCSSCEYELDKSPTLPVLPECYCWKGDQYFDLLNDPDGDLSD